MKLFKSKSAERTPQQIDAELAEAQQALHDASVLHEEAALTDEPAALDDARKRLQVARNRVELLQAARQAASRIATAKARQAAARAAEKVRDGVRDYLSRRESAAAKVADAIDQFAKTYRELIEVSEAMVAAAQPIGGLPIGAKASRAELYRLLQQEMWRLSAGPNPINPGAVLPGADPQSQTHRAPDAMQPLVEAIAQSNAHVAGVFGELRATA